MSFSAQQCLDNARECEWMASQAKDGDAKAAFVDCVRQWLELARKREVFERNRF
jgi:hypothetical protein